MSILSGAYGRDYKSKKAALKDFNEGKDFVENDLCTGNAGRYTSILDYEKGEEVFIRYAKMRKMLITYVK